MGLGVLENEKNSGLTGWMCVGELVPVWLSMKGDVHLVVKDRVIVSSHMTQLSYNHSTFVWGNGMA